jgi:hypothetical protein
MVVPRLVFATLALILATVLVACDGDSDDDADLEAALAFLDAAIRVDIRPSEGDIIYSRTESEGRNVQGPPVQERWYRIGPGLVAVERLSRESETSGALRNERHETDEMVLTWAKDGAFAMRSRLVEGSMRLVELTDSTVTAQWSLAQGEWSSQAEQLGIEDAVEEIFRITIDDRGWEVQRHMFVLTDSGEEITVTLSRSSFEIVNDMPAPTPR